MLSKNKIKYSEKLHAIILIISFVTVMLSGIVSAEPTGQTPTVGTPATYDPAAGSATAKGGNITNITFSNMLTSTNKWQGYYGNVSGSIILGTAAGDKMFEWPVSTMAGQVFASQDTDVNFTEWVALQNRTGAQIDTDFGFTAADSDSATKTFNDDPSAIVVAGRSIDGVANTSAKTYNAADAETWWTIALAGSSPAEANYVFAGIISNDGNAYDGTTKDFQMIVPVNAAPETYYFYVELT